MAPRFLEDDLLGSLASQLQKKSIPNAWIQKLEDQNPTIIRFKHKRLEWSAAIVKDSEGWVALRLAVGHPTGNKKKWSILSDYKITGIYSLDDVNLVEVLSNTGRIAFLAITVAEQDFCLSYLHGQAQELLLDVGAQIQQLLKGGLKVTLLAKDISNTLRAVMKLLDEDGNIKAMVKDKTTPPPMRPPPCSLILGVLEKGKQALGGVKARPKVKAKKSKLIGIPQSGKGSLHPGKISVLSSGDKDDKEDSASKDSVFGDSLSGDSAPRNSNMEDSETESDGMDITHNTHDMDGDTSNDEVEEAHQKKSGNVVTDGEDGEVGKACEAGKEGEDAHLVQTVDADDEEEDLLNENNDDDEVMDTQ